MADPSTSIPPAAIAAPVLSSIALLLDLPPFFWHVKHGNLAATTLVFWIILCIFFDGLNSLIWPKADTADWWKGYVLCDIQVKLVGAWEAGIPGAVLCIMRNLSKVLDTEHTVLIPSKAMRRKQLAFDLFFCIGIPIYMISIHYVVQPSRYYIFQLAGCIPPWDNSWPTIVLMVIMPPLLSLGAVYYGFLVIIRARRYERDFAAILSSSNSNLTKSRFKRLFLMSITLITVVLPIQLYLFSTALLTELIPYDWEAIHAPGWSERIILVPTYGKLRFDRWIHFLMGFALFLFFGLGKDAVAMYRSWMLSIGLARLFPSLFSGGGASSSPGVQSSIGSSTTVNSLGSRARAVFFSKKKFTDASWSSQTTNTVSTFTSCASSSKPQKVFFAPPSTIIEGTTSTTTRPAVAIHTMSFMEEEQSYRRQGSAPSTLRSIGMFFDTFPMWRLSPRSTRKIPDGIV